MPATASGSRAAPSTDQAASAASTAGATYIAPAVKQLQVLLGPSPAIAAAAAAAVPDALTTASSSRQDDVVWDAVLGMYFDRRRNTFSFAMP